MTKMFSKFYQATDKARRILLGARKNWPFAVYFRSHVNMVEQSPSTKVQALYDLCKNTFTPSEIPSSSPAINKLCSLLDTVRPADVGLKEENPDDDRGHGIFGLNRLSRAARWAQPITYIDIYECDSFTLAKLAVDKVLTAPCGTSILYPKSGGNLHCFTAVTPCAVLDILTPSYREDVGRKCSYYHDYPYSPFSSGNGSELGDGKEEDYAWLAEIETPDNLYMRPGIYTGPAVNF
ncbi:plant cysteine oxidase 3 isoform X4 [Jatropha curcas]|uniref:plant cysteine oxidase 3 isoform X4 n=1 Tax=Jatropha curcas TaxID=180498 RepID=UPI0009D6E179|nr:plant cysteine oxidase 3 isoform X4 [Jatropha curcas]